MIYKLKNISKFKRGFTLIELLIVIVIIGTLATFFIANYLGVRKIARDSQRKSNLRQIRAAIELIRSDTGSYPLMPLYTIDCPTSSPLKVGAVIYMNKIPCDPSSISFLGGPDGDYFYLLTGNTYTLQACIENSNDKGSNIATVVLRACSSNKAFKLTSP